jgi:hypothetical protein
MKALAFAAAIRCCLLWTRSDERNGVGAQIRDRWQRSLPIDRFRDALDVGTGRLFAADQFPMNDG